MASVPKLRPPRYACFATFLGLVFVALGGCAPSGTGPTLAAPAAVARVEPTPRASLGRDIRARVRFGEGILAPVALAKADVVIDLISSDSLSPWGLPLRGTKPWVRAVQRAAGTVSDLTLRVPQASSGGVLIAWVDLNRNGRLDVGDHVSDPTAILDGVELSLRHIWVTRLASTPPRPMQVVFDLPDSEPPTHGRILLLGWDELTGGSIPRTPPARTWRSESRRREWPESVEMSVVGLSEMHVLPVLDRDGDDRPGPGDLLASPLPPGALRGGAHIVFSLPFGVPR